MSSAFDLTVKAMRDEGMSSDQILEELSKLFGDWMKGYKPHESDREKVERYLMDMYMPTNLSGFDYWVEAILRYREKKDVSSMNIIYKQIAEDSGNSSGSVLVAMKRALQTAYERCPPEIRKSLFGEERRFKKGVPTSSEFISIIISKI